MTDLQLAAECVLLYGFIGVLVYIAMCVQYEDPADYIENHIDPLFKPTVALGTVILWPVGAAVRLYAYFSGRFS